MRQTKQVVRVNRLGWIVFAALNCGLFFWPGLATPPDSAMSPESVSNDPENLSGTSRVDDQFSLSSLLLSPAQADAASSTSLRIYHVNVGQGDATIIVGPGSLDERKVMVIDAGDTPRFGHVDGGLRVIQALRRLGISKVDYAVLTHFDADHVGGFATGSGTGHSFLMGEDSAPGAAGVDDDGDGKGDWLDSKKVTPDRDEMGLGDDFYRGSTLFIDRGDADVASTKANIRYRKFANPARRHKVTNRTKVGKIVDLGEGAQATVVCGNGWVWGRGTKVPKVTTENERSVGMLVSYGNFDYLIAGDLIGQAYAAEDANVEEPLADVLITRGVRIDVLHVNHHGASNSSRPEFIQKLSPLVGVISVGDGNEYDHPSAQTLTTLYGRDVKVYQTETGQRGSVSGQGASTVLNGHVLVEVEEQTGAGAGAGDSPRQRFSVRDWGTLGTVQVSDRYQVR